MLSKELRPWGYVKDTQNNNEVPAITNSLGSDVIIRNMSQTHFMLIFPYIE